MNTDILLFFHLQYVPFGCLKNGTSRSQNLNGSKRDIEPLPRDHERAAHHRAWRGRRPRAPADQLSALIDRLDPAAWSGFRRASRDRMSRRLHVLTSAGRHQRDQLACRTAHLHPRSVVERSCLSRDRLVHRSRRLLRSAPRLRLKFSGERRHLRPDHLLAQVHLRNLLPICEICGSGQNICGICGPSA